MGPMKDAPVILRGIMGEYDFPSGFEAGYPEDYTDHSWPICFIYHSGRKVAMVSVREDHLYYLTIGSSRGAPHRKYYYNEYDMVDQFYADLSVTLSKAID